ncbi:MAG: putative cytochrome c peroxidase precursor [Bacteroidetes bacterium]|jgi:cytochrome c peroxidase|nr:putative cytochrome c peroxidase precursor [Bacteroidota bacterium]
MKNKLLIFFVIIVSFGFIRKLSESPVTKNDVVLKYPVSFPKPLYNFEQNKLSPEIFTLGRKLFYDPILSKDSSTSCESCHQRPAAFAHIDHALSHGINSRIGTRNVPALQNLIWKDAFMWDGGVNHLEVQAINPITNPDEMGESLENIINKLRRNKEYATLFRKAYRDSIINSERILKALTQFTGLMISANSRYDRYISGKDTFSDQEKNGLDLFRKKCASCHKEPLFTDNSYHNNGLKPDSSLNDKGRAKLSAIEKDNYKFKIPGLRNIELTFPYMHDGRFRKLKDVMNHYSESANKNMDSDEKLKGIGSLSDKEKKDIIAFLLTLTDREFLNDKRFADPNFR